MAVQMNYSTQVEDCLSNLNEQQKEAVLHNEGPIMVLSGAGTGKTRVITAKISHILTQQLCSPENLLAITFTNKAARELKERVEHATGLDVKKMYIGTFHDISTRILMTNDHYARVGLDPQFRTRSDSEQKSIIKDILKKRKILYYGFRGNNNSQVHQFLDAISRMKREGHTPEDAVHSRTLRVDPLMINVYREYQEYLLETNTVDFDDLIFYIVKLLREHEDIREHYQERFQYIMIDEYQDVDIGQQQWIEYLSGKCKSICAVGDDDQLIYVWRGAEEDNMKKFQEKFKPCKIVRLEQNYRSTNNILRAAGSLIANNYQRFEKKLWSDLGDGEKLVLRALQDEKLEARYIAHKIKSMVPYAFQGDTDFSCNDTDAKSENTRKLSDIAILVRKWTQLNDIERALQEMSVPYAIQGKIQFHDRAEVKDVLAYMRLIAYPNDWEALDRIKAKPRRGLGSALLEKMKAFSLKHHLGIVKVIKTMTSSGIITGTTMQSLNKLTQLLEESESLEKKGQSQEAVLRLLDGVEYVQYIEQDKDDPEKAHKVDERLENIREICESLSGVTSLKEHLDYFLTSIPEEKGQLRDEVRVTTIHGAKGLEFDTVFLPACEEGFVPGADDLEEERRLCYVAMTRAKNNLIMTYANVRHRSVASTPSRRSRFLSEITKEVPEVFESIPGGVIQEEKRDSLFYRGPKPSVRKESMTTNTRMVQSLERGMGCSGNLASRALAPGQKVHHDKFGPGKVISSDAKIAKIEFNRGMIKKIITSYFDSK